MSDSKSCRRGMLRPTLELAPGMPYDFSTLPYHTTHRCSYPTALCICHRPPRSLAPIWPSPDLRNGKAEAPRGSLTKKRRKEKKKQEFRISPPAALGKAPHVLSPSPAPPSRSTNHKPGKYDSLVTGADQAGAGECVGGQRLDRRGQGKFSHTPILFLLPSSAEPPYTRGHEPWHRPLPPELDRRSCRVFTTFPLPRRWASSRTGTARWLRAPWAGGSGSMAQVTYVLSRFLTTRVTAAIPPPWEVFVSRGYLTSGVV